MLLLSYYHGHADLSVPLILRTVDGLYSTEARLYLRAGQATRCKSQGFTLGDRALAREHRAEQPVDLYNRASRHTHAY